MSDRLITSIKLIGRYSRHNEQEDWRFRTFLKCRESLSNAELDAIVAEETDIVEPQIDCIKCANCCKNMQPSLDDADIKRLASHFNISTKAFTDRYVMLNEFEERCMAQMPCPFLSHETGCTVYEIRPTACRDFPYLRKPDFLSRSMAMVANNETCPIVFNVWQSLKRRFWGDRGK